MDNVTYFRESSRKPLIRNGKMNSKFIAIKCMTLYQHLDNTEEEKKKEEVEEEEEDQRKQKREKKKRVQQRRTTLPNSISRR